MAYRCKSSPVAGEEDHGDAGYVLGAYVCLERLWNLQRWKFSKVSCIRPRENITTFKVRLRGVLDLIASCGPQINYPIIQYSSPMIA